MFDGKVKTTEYGSLVVTHECNKHCKFCIDKYRGQHEYITLENVNKALTKANEQGLKEILIVGGEPTLHPNIIEIAKMVKEFGFKSILTTNYTTPWIIKQLDGIVDCFNISYYNQRILPIQNDFISDITITTLIHKKQLPTKKQLDAFIDKYQNYGHLKFSTLSICNEWTKQMQKVEYLDLLDAEKLILFDEIEGLKYRDCIIKRYDKLINNNSYQSYKFHVDGEISQSWERGGKIK
jgi:organic radical activating enzyme